MLFYFSQLAIIGLMEGLEFTLPVWCEWALDILEVQFLILGWSIITWNIIERRRRGPIMIANLKILTIVLIILISDEILKSHVSASSLKVS